MVDGVVGAAPLVESITVIYEFKPIHEWTVGNVTSSLTARIIEKKGKKFLDVREYQISPHFTGYTKRGLRMTVHELRILGDYVIPFAYDMLKTSTQSESKSVCNTQAATDAEKPKPQDS